MPVGQEITKFFEKQPWYFYAGGAVVIVGAFIYRMKSSQLTSQLSTIQTGITDLQKMEAAESQHHSVANQASQAYGDLSTSGKGSGPGRYAHIFNGNIPGDFNDNTWTG